MHLHLSLPQPAQIWLTTDAAMKNIAQRTVAQIQNEVMQRAGVTFNLNNNLCGPTLIRQINAIIKRPRSGDVSHSFIIFLELMGVFLSLPRIMNHQQKDQPHLIQCMLLVHFVA